MVLLAWAGGVEALKAPLAGGATMKANTALCFMLVGLALASMSNQGVLSRPGRVLGASAALLAAATLVEYATSWDLRIDQLLVTDDPGSSPPGRMSPATALCFGALGLGLSLSVHTRWLFLRDPLGLLSLAASGIAALGYVYDTRALYTVGPYTSMAPHTAALMTLLSFALLSKHPSGGGVSGIVLAHDLGGATARRLLPWVVAVPVVVGWLRLQGQRAGLWGAEFGAALVVIATIAIASTVVLLNARALRLSERSERKAMAQLSELTQSLEQRVHAATRELSQRELELRAVAERSQQSEARFRALLESAPDAMVITDEAGVVTLANQQAERLFGYTRHEFVGLPVDHLLPPRFRTAHASHRRSYLRGPGTRGMGIGLDLWAIDKHGREFPVEVSLSPIDIESRVLISTAIRDVTWRRELEADRRRFVYLAEQSQDFIGMCDTAFTPFYVNEAGRRLVGLDRLEHGRRVAVADFFFPEDRPFIEREFLPRVIREGHGAAEIRFRHFLTGEALWMNYRVSSLRDERGEILGWATISSDITAHRQAQEALRASLRDKETLLREVHHRVKNNLAVIGSLLYLQSNAIADPSLRSVLQESQERVRSIALVHERLYRSHDVAQVDFAAYVRELSAELVRNHITDATDIRLTFELDTVAIDLDRAVLAGLILNEAITNALKHAFAGVREGVIRVGLVRDGSGFVLRVADDGVGLPADVALQSRPSLGMRLMHALASQLGGRLEFHAAHPGTEVVLATKDADVRC
jgi:PAS domain S-box-containing protein